MTLLIACIGIPHFGGPAPDKTFIDNVDRCRFDIWAEYETLHRNLPAIPELSLPRATAAQVPTALQRRLAERGPRPGRCLRDIYQGGIRGRNRRRCRQVSQPRGLTSTGAAGLFARRS